MTEEIRHWYAPVLTEVEGFAKIEAHRSGGRIEISGISPGWVWNGLRYFRIGVEAFETSEEAIAQAKVLRREKIASLREQIKRLKRLGV